MPFFKDQYLDEITYRLSVLRVELTSNNSLHRYNSNTSAEDFFCGLLNIIYDWQLTNINHKTIQAPGIDLIDTNNQIAIQVSSQSDHYKIQDSLIKLIDKYPHLNNCHFYMMVITSKQRKYIKSFNTENIHFDKDKDIWDVDSLLKEIQKLSTQKLEQINNYIKKEQGLLSIPEPGRGGNQVSMSREELAKSPYLFISYCHKDRTIVFPILHQFKEAGIRYWYYDDNINPGQKYAQKIEEAIDYSQGAIVFITENTVESEWCRDEILDCLEEKKGYVIPIYMEQVRLKYGLRIRLRGIDYFDLSTKSTQSANINQLITFIKNKNPEVFKNIELEENNAVNLPSQQLPVEFEEHIPRRDAFNIRNNFTFLLGKYPQSTKGKATNVEWKIIGHDPHKEQLIAISTLILDVQPYDNRNEYTGALYWEDTSLYSWLHTDLYNTLFSEKEKKLVQDITILNEEEVNTFFSSNKSRKAAGSNYAIIEKGLHTDDRFFDAMGEYGQWWLRSDIVYGSKQRRVFCDGAIYPRGRKVTRVDIGIRPVIRLNNNLLPQSKIARLKVSPQ